MKREPNYNRRSGTASEQHFKVGEQVLVFLPNERNKLLTDWQGPYAVTKNIISCTYEIDVHDRRKRKRVFHVDALKQWHSPEAAVLLFSRSSIPKQLKMWRMSTSLPGARQLKHTLQTNSPHSYTVPQPQSEKGPGRPEGKV